MWIIEFPSSSPLTIGAVDDIRVNAGVGEEEGKAFGPALVSRRPQWRASYEEEEGGGRREEEKGRNGENKGGIKLYK